MQEVKIALARRNRRESAEVVQEGPREEEIVESYTEDEEIIEERDETTLYLHTRCSGSRWTSSSNNSGSNQSWHVIEHGKC